MALVTIDTVVEIAADIRVLEIGCVIAAVASGALEDGIVVRIDMARGAHVVGVAMVGRELRILRVVERSAGPGRGVVAGLARGGEELRLCRVTGVRGVVVVNLVAADASRRQGRVIVVDVAVRTHSRRHYVRAGERECRVVVVERGIRPDRCVVAEFARGREAGRGVGRGGRTRVIFLMA